MVIVELAILNRNEHSAYIGRNLSSLEGNGRLDIPVVHERTIDHEKRRRWICKFIDEYESTRDSYVYPMRNEYRQ